jgi:hypothetical protein
MFIDGSSSAVPIDTASPTDMRKRFYPELTAGGGFESGRGRLRLLPENSATHAGRRISRGPAECYDLIPTRQS